MTSRDANMTRLSIRLGFWSALLCLGTFVVFVGCFVGTITGNSLYTWTGMPDYVAYVTTRNQILKIVAQLSMLLFAPLYVLLLNSLHGYAEERMKILSRVAVSFGVIFALLVSMHYFVQLTAVRLSVLKGHVEGLEQIIQGNPHSAFSALNMLGWTVFFGLSSLFVAPIFTVGKLEKRLRALFVLNGLFCIVGAVGYALDNVAIVFFTINVGMGAAVIITMWLLALLFRRMGRESPAEVGE